MENSMYVQINLDAQQAVTTVAAVYAFVGVVAHKIKN